MLVPLPADPAHRKRALAWLIAERIDHMVLFKAVTIPDDTNAESFKVWLGGTEPTSTEA